MTAADIDACLLGKRWRKHFTVPRYTPAKWFEADIFELTDAGYFREYEIKMTRTDFLADAEKMKEVFPRPYGAPRIEERKHDLLAAKSTRGPVQFWFVTPVGLVRMNEVPEWAGLIEVRPDGRFRFSEVEVMKAPRLHGEKCPLSVVNHARGVCYYRMQNLMRGAARIRQKSIEQAEVLRRFGWPRVTPPVAV